MSLKALGLNENLRNVLMETISFLKTRFTQESSRRNTFIRGSTYHVPGTKLRGGNTKK